ncbi:MAG: MBL fold metallo-hydrolase RNA specificity domain-containing protein, partial [Promethearchaeota archaeon]
ITKLIQNACGPVFLEHPIRDLDRLVSIYQATKQSNRELVISPKIACLIEMLEDLSPIKIEDLLILIPKKGWCLLGKESNKDLLSKDYSSTPWVQKYLDYGNMITAESVAKDQSRFVISMNLWEISQLIDIRPKNGVWIMSRVEPFSDELKLDDKRKKNWLAHFKLQHKIAHASGHAAGPEIIEMIKKICPKVLIPIHTEKPTIFRESLPTFKEISVQILKNGDNIDI